MSKYIIEFSSSNDIDKFIRKKYLEKHNDFDYNEYDDYVELMSNTICYILTLYIYDLLKKHLLTYDEMYIEKDNTDYDNRGLDNQYDDVHIVDKEKIFDEFF